MRTIDVSGTATAGFEELADVFGRLAATLPAGGAALSVYQHGENVASLTAGDYPTPARQLVFSVSKLMLSIAVHRVAARGQIDLDRPLSELWPASSVVPGSESVSFRQLLAHRTGFAAPDIAIGLTELLAGGDRGVLLGLDSFSVHGRPGYHAVTFGTVLGAVVEAALGCTAAELLADEVATPLHADVALGAGAEGVTPVRFSEPVAIRTPFTVEPVPDALIGTLVNDPTVFNSAAFLSAGMPSMGVVATAAGLATVMAATLGEIGGVRLLDNQALGGLTAPLSAGVDRVLGVQTAFGSGAQLPFPRLPFTGPSAFGHEGAGGSVAFADPELGLAVGFTTDVFPAATGASPVLLGLLPTLRLLGGRALS